ncbi:hypothetical protein MGSAQ_000427, partial [marine sediment metagenome]
RSRFARCAESPLKKDIEQWPFGDRIVDAFFIDDIVCVTVDIMIS